MHALHINGRISSFDAQDYRSTTKRRLSDDIAKARDVMTLALLVLPAAGLRWLPSAMLVLACWWGYRRLLAHMRP